MRYIDETIRARLLQAQKTLYNNANPSMDIIAVRPQTPITNKDLWQEVIVTPGITATNTSVAIRRRITGRQAERAYVAYISGGVLTVKYADMTYPVSQMTWITVETIPNCIACAVEFDGSFVSTRDRKVEYLTDTLPWLFFVTSTGELKAGILGSEYETLAGANVTEIDAVRGVASRYKDEDQGLIIFYVISGVIYYRQHIAGIWEDASTVSIAPENIVSIKAERTFDWRIVLQATDVSGALHEIFSRMVISGWTEHGLIRPIGATLEAYSTVINYMDDKTDQWLTIPDITHESWNMSIYSPVLIGAANIATSTEDPENPGQYYDDYGYRVVFEFDQIIRNAADYPADFKLIDDYSMTWYGQSATVNGRFVTVTFANFNNAGNPITAIALAGNLSNGYVLLTQTSFEFSASGLVPYYVPSPVAQTAWNTDANTIFITFDLPIVNIAVQTGFAVTALEPDMSPGGTLSTKTYGFSAVNIEADPHTIKIVLTTVGRLKFPQGDVTIDFSGSMYGQGNASVAPFSISFTPIITAFVFNPNSQSYLHPATALLTTNRPEVAYSQYQFRPGEACIRPASATMVSARIHIDDLPE